MGLRGVEAVAEPADYESAHVAVPARELQNQGE